MTKIPLYIKRGRNFGKRCGYYDQETKTYNKTINYKSNQMMQSPKNIGRIGISKTILAQLQGYKCEKICIQVTGFEKRSFYIIIHLDNFIKNGKEENWDDVQVLTHMKHFIRLDSNQLRLKNEQ